MTDGDHDESEPAEYELVMPFVVCQDHGGPYEAGAFVGGVYYGKIDRQLEVEQPAMFEQYVPSELVPQLDLLAMHHGYTMESEPWRDHPEDWTWVAMRKIDSPTPPH